MAKEIFPSLKDKYVFPAIFLTLFLVGKSYFESEELSRTYKEAYTIAQRLYGEKDKENDKQGLYSLDRHKWFEKMGVLRHGEPSYDNLKTFIKFSEKLERKVE